MSSHVVSIRHELSLSVIRMIALSRITDKAMMQNLVPRQLAIPLPLEPSCTRELLSRWA
jgi:hypothetical protein